MLALYLVIAIKSVAVADRYIQQTEADQELAFRKAFTLELIASRGRGAVRWPCSPPLLALAYGRDELLAPALALALVLPGLALQAPVWIFYRRLDFLRQRLLLAADPMVALVVTIALAAAGFGYWSLVVGLIAGSLGGGRARARFSPYRLGAALRTRDVARVRALLAAVDALGRPRADDRPARGLLRRARDRPRRRRGDRAGGHLLGLLGAGRRDRHADDLSR